MISSDKSRIGVRTAVLYLLLMLSGCATLPDYAAPTISVLDDDDIDLSDVIPYRALTRDDFRGTRPPREFDARMAAVTCVYTQPLVDKKSIEIQPVRTPGGIEAFEVTYGNLRFRALMNRSCSWWNSAVGGFEEEYVLEHEQIHFALFEIAARRWSAEPPIKLQLKADNREAMLENLQAQFEEILQDRLAVLLAQNHKFDEETSVGHNPAKQQRWLEMVQLQLATTTGYAPDLPEHTTTARRCQVSSSARESIARAKASLRAARYRPAMIRLIEEAEAAIRAPECDSVRARILADKAIAVATDPAAEPCQLKNQRASRAIDSAIAAWERNGSQPEAGELIARALAAMAPPECDAVRARILADKAGQLATESAE